MALSISAGNGGVTSQANTQSPQTSAAAGTGSPAAAPGKSVQPGTATSLLSGPGGGSDGIPLSSTVLPVASLNSSTQTTTAQAQPATTKSQHHPNAILLGIVAVLVVLAVAAMWLTQRSAKNTTHY